MFSKTEDLLDALANEAMAEVDVRLGMGGPVSVDHVIDVAKDAFWQKAQQLQVRATTVPMIQEFVRGVQKESGALYRSLMERVRGAIQTAPNLTPAQKQALAAAVEKVITETLRGTLLVKAERLSL